MHLHYCPTSLYDLARGEIVYRAWLTRFVDAAGRATGVKPVRELWLGPRLRRWFRAGLSPYDAVRKWQSLKPGRD